MDLHSREVDNMWQKLGFTLDYGSADVKANLIIDDKLILRTRRSHGRGRLGGNIPYMIRQQMKLNQAQFEDAIACPLGRQDYLHLLRSKGWLPPKQ